MENEYLGLPSNEADEPRPAVLEGASAQVQTPLTDRETIGFYRALQEERERRHALEKEFDALKSGRGSSPGPSTYSALGTTVYANNLRVSRRFAEAEHGREVVTAVHDWAAAKCDTDPDFNARMRASDDPYEAAKKIYDQENFSSKAVHSELIAMPPRSLADAPGNGAVGKPFVPFGSGNAYESLFK